MNRSGMVNHLQLITYSYAYQILYQKSPGLLKLVNLIKTKRPRIITLEVDGEKLDYTRFFHRARQVLKGIRTKVFFPEVKLYGRGL
ncbi:MAG: hypothetical protein ACFFBS_07195 [Promethearchaeota archaeon]